MWAYIIILQTPFCLFGSERKIFPDYFNCPLFHFPTFSLRSFPFPYSATRQLKTFPLHSLEILTPLIGERRKRNFSITSSTALYGTQLDNLIRLISSDTLIMAIAYCEFSRERDGSNCDRPQTYAAATRWYRSPLLYISSNFQYVSTVEIPAIILSILFFFFLFSQFVCTLRVTRS
jgi:hypothetical protein